MSSFLLPENAAIIDEVRDSYELAALLGAKKIVNGIAPPKTPYPYISLGAMTERERSMMMLQGAEGTINATIWDYGTDIVRILAIYKEFNALFHNNRFTLSDGKLIRCKVELIFTGAGDQIDPKILRGIARMSLWAIKKPS